MPPVLQQMGASAIGVYPSAATQTVRHISRTANIDQPDRRLTVSRDAPTVLPHVWRDSLRTGFTSRLKNVQSMDGAPPQATWMLPFREFGMLLHLHPASPRLLASPAHHDPPLARTPAPVDLSARGPARDRSPALSSILRHNKVWAEPGTKQCKSLALCPPFFFSSAGAGRSESVLQGQGSVRCWRTLANQTTETGDVKKKTRAPGRLDRRLKGDRSSAGKCKKKACRCRLLASSVSAQPHRPRSNVLYYFCRGRA